VIKLGIETPRKKESDHARDQNCKNWCASEPSTKKNLFSAMSYGTDHSVLKRERERRRRDREWGGAGEEGERERAARGGVMRTRTIACDKYVSLRM